ncbi:hypothetical protein BC830DRAFT_1157662 [Chytriomyces sp. MP71]|nr:hypothetical protein BC830DRAFT_1157662 [Chytriomyces sp. MP71]
MLLLQLHALALWAALVSSQVFNTTLSSSVLVSQRTDAPAAQSHPSSSSMPSTSASTVSFSSTLPAPSPAPTLLLDSNRPTPTSNGNANPDAIWIPSPPANGSNVYVPFAIEG